jgi:hypothetical protein
MASQLPPDANALWKSYLAAESRECREEKLTALHRFLQSIESVAQEVIDDWARGLAQEIADDHVDLPIRMPLFRQVVFPALRAGMDAGIPGCARSLAAFSQLLYKSPDLSASLPEDQRTELGLLNTALRLDPSDVRARSRLIAIMERQLKYAIHEAPAGVLYGIDGATIEQCEELHNCVAVFGQHVATMGIGDRYEGLISECRLHFTAYADYLAKHANYSSYASYLAEHRREAT